MLVLFKQTPCKFRGGSLGDPLGDPPWGILRGGGWIPWGDSPWESPGKSSGGESPRVIPWGNSPGGSPGGIPRGCSGVLYRICRSPSQIRPADPPYPKMTLRNPPTCMPPYIPTTIPKHSPTKLCRLCSLHSPERLSRAREQRTCPKELHYFVLIHV